MPLYRVRAYDPKGDLKNLRKEAEGEEELIRSLTLEGYAVADIAAEKSEGRANEKKQPLKLADQHLFCTMVAAFLKSGLSLTEVLKLLQRQTRDKTLKPVLAELREGVEGGRSLGAAMQQQGVFRASLVGMVESGERSSSLPQTLERAGALLQSEVALRRKIQSALTYPFMMLGVGLCVVAFLLAYVVPNLTQIVVDSGKSLPFATKMLIFISGAVRKGGIPVLLLLFFGYFYLKKNNKQIQIPLFNDIRQNLLFSLIFSQLATLLKAGVPLVQALEMTEPIDRIKGRIPQVAEDVRQGYRFSQGLEREGSFPEEVVTIVRVGEVGGNLPECLERVAENAWEFAQASMQKWSNLAEPIIILVMGLLVGFVVIAVLLPIFDMSSLVN